MAFDQRSASTIFVEGEEGHPDDAGVAPESDERVPHHFDTARAGIDSVSAWPVTVVLIGAVVWLVLGSTFGMIASLKLRSDEHTSELQSLMRISYAVLCLQKKT